MFALTEIIYSASPKYLQYFSRKTGFLVADFQAACQNNVRWLWRHLSRNYNFQNQYAILNKAEKDMVRELLLNFGYLPYTNEITESMEKKIPWLFAHPVSGIFVPLEIVKLLMQEEIFFKENYLFSLVYRLKIKEQKYFASLMGGSLEGQVALSFENNALDMGLVLYIWLGEHMRNIGSLQNIIPDRGKILKSPFAFTREGDSAPWKSRDLRSLIPENPVPIWDYLYEHFSHMKDDIDKLHTLIHRGNKGFYRSLALLRNQGGDLIKAFKSGILIPLIPYKNNTKNKVRIKLVSPVELRYLVHKMDVVKLNKDQQGN
ncbi:MAG: hypothetical protein OEV66_04685 [Spirochaetia bacterium]|nr:hypothetical protein [Spirochaetia bacterium]